MFIMWLLKCRNSNTGESVETLFFRRKYARRFLKKIHVKWSVFTDRFDRPGGTMYQGETPPGVLWTLEPIRVVNTDGATQQKVHRCKKCGCLFSKGGFHYTFMGWHCEHCHP